MRLVKFRDKLISRETHIVSLRGARLRSPTWRLAGILPVEGGVFKN